MAAELGGLQVRATTGAAENLRGGGWGDSRGGQRTQRAAGTPSPRLPPSGRPPGLRPPPPGSPPSWEQAPAGPSPVVCAEAVARRSRGAPSLAPCAPASRSRCFASYRRWDPGQVSPSLALRA